MLCRASTQFSPSPKVDPPPILGTSELRRGDAHFKFRPDITYLDIPWYASKIYQYIYVNIYIYVYTCICIYCVFILYVYVYICLYMCNITTVLFCFFR